MKYICKETDDLEIFSRGSRLRVTAIFDSVKAANAHMKTQGDDAVVYCIGPLIFTANKLDNGEVVTL